LTVAGLQVSIDQRGDKRQDKPEKDDVDGRVSDVSGSCPNLSMRVSGRAVETDRSTKFRRGDCSDIRPGAEVKVKGKRTGDGPIVADEVEIKSRR